MEKIKREKQTALRNIRNTANLPSKKEWEEIEKIRLENTNIKTELLN